MVEDSAYYKGKILNLFHKLFISPGNAKTRFINAEQQFSAAYYGSHYNGVPCEIKVHWERIWKELNVKEALEMTNLTYSTFNRTVSSKHNKSLIQYLEFILSEYSRLTSKVQ